MRSCDLDGSVLQKYGEVEIVESLDYNGLTTSEEIIFLPTPWSFFFLPFPEDLILHNLYTLKEMSNKTMMISFRDQVS